MMSLREARDRLAMTVAVAPSEEKPVKAILCTNTPVVSNALVVLPPPPLREDLVMSPYRWELHDDADMLSAGYAKFLLWGHNLRDETVLIIIKDYAISLYFAFPCSTASDDHPMWDVEDARAVHSTLMRCMGDNSSNIMPFDDEDFCHHRVLYYYSPVVPMVRVSFRNDDAQRHASNILKKGVFINTRRGDRVFGEVLLWEIKSILKLMKTLNAVYCGWLKCRARLIDDPMSKLSSIDKEYVVRHTTISRDGSIEKVPRPKWCSYDIETYSHNHHSHPCKVLADDPCYLITLVLWRDGSARKDWQSVAILLGDCIIEDDKVRDCATIIKVNTVLELLDEFTRQIVLGDPDLLTGYNILGYDNDYINCQYGINGVRTWPVTGRLLGSVRPMIEPVERQSKVFSNKTYMPWSPGRTYMDLYGYATRTYSLVTYSLANLAVKIFPKDEDMRKKDIPYKLQFEIFARTRAALARRRDDPDQDITAELKEMGKVVVYCFYDSYLVAGIITKINWWITIRETCNAMACQPEDLYIRGTQMKIDALLYVTSMEMGVIVNKRETVSFGYKGGSVQHPVIGVTPDVIIGDVQSLYPNIIISYNLCYTTLLRPDEYAKYAALEQFHAMVPITDDEEDDEETQDHFSLTKSVKKDKIVPVYHDVDFGFVGVSVYKGVLPTMLKRLLDKRAEVRSIETSDAIMKVVYFSRQLTLKLTANGGYGFTGVRKNKGMRPCLEIAATTTTLGRAAIAKGIEWVLRTYECRLIYGDTDSFMITLPLGIPPDKMWQAGKDIMANANKQFDGLVFEFEGKYNLLCFKHKMYVKESFAPPDKKTGVYSNLLILDENGDPDLEIKGLAPARRDNCQWVRDHLRVLLRMVLARRSFADIVAYCTLSVVNLYNQQVPLRDLVLSKGYKSGLKSETAPMKVFAAEMAKHDQIILPGERHEYLVVHCPQQKTVSKRMILLSLYLSMEEHRRPMIDYTYYFENLVRDKTDMMIGAAFASQHHVICRWVLEHKSRVFDGRAPMLLLQKSMKLGVPISEYVSRLVGLGV